ncbi:MAG: FprA family A-type flavoprotein [Bacilli bacterium]
MVSVNKIKENIYQIKVIDREVRNFHGCVYPVLHGSTYNSYLVLDEQVTLIDMIDDIYFDEIYPEIIKLLNGRDVDNIIINHVEPDHSGSYELIINKFKNAKTYTSKAGEKAMQAHFFKAYHYHTVGLNDSIKTGKYTFSFMETPLVHWPDNMWTYLHEEQILFSNDAFGQLLVDDVVYDSDVSLFKFVDFMKEYYANIVYPCNVNVERALNALSKSKWSLKLIAPSHGLVLKDYIKESFSLYHDMIGNKTIDKAIVVYESMWGNTKAMALVIANELKAKGYEVKIYQLSRCHISEVMKELCDAKLLAIGSGNYNNCVLPPVAAFLERLHSTKYLNRQALVFGSYGWIKAPLQKLVERLNDANFNVISDPMYIQYVPNDDEKSDLQQAVNLTVKKISDL